MWNELEQIAVTLVLAVLRMVIKNPSTAAKEKTVIAQIATLATEADTATNGTVWTSTSATS